MHNSAITIEALKNGPDSLAKGETARAAFQLWKECNPKPAIKLVSETPYEVLKKNFTKKLSYNKGQSLWFQDRTGKTRKVIVTDIKPAISKYRVQDIETNDVMLAHPAKIQLRFRDETKPKKEWCNV